ncbi:HAD-IIIA family hydrolase [Flavobacterium ajazii]|uniref:HAD-IIIA family hydrolase n=1 Tax=Flavobacterium ajazii TaxID=2692318 RepID=UPI0013D0EA31|nr:HAD-IIIA family hydrolase [Flavobacterium ajazii]
MKQQKDNIDVAILAGGMGSRLKSRTGNLPKPMALLLGKPVLEHQIELCKKFGLFNITLLVHYEHEVISDYFKDGSDWGVTISYIIEREPRGTAGALFDAFDFLSDRILVMYGDTYLDVNLEGILGFHVNNQADVTLMVHPNDHPNDSDLVEIDNNCKILAIHPYPHPENIYLPNLVNAALYVVEKEILTGVIPKTGKYDLAKDTFPTIINIDGNIFGYVSQEYIKDMGTPERLDKVERDIVLGLPEKLSTRDLRTAIFLDRDGTINEEVNHLSQPEQLVLINGAAEGIRKINRSGMLAVGITNQPVIARGDVTWGGLKKIHNKLDYDLGLKNAYLDKIYVCPHHPHKGFSGEIADLKIECNCRKPKTGLIDLAIQELEINRRKSWFIGDTTSDIKAGKNSGLHTVLVRTGHAGTDAKYSIKPDFIFSDLEEAIDWVIEGYALLTKRIMPIIPLASEARMILIGGPARAGKSSTAKVVEELLLHIGKTVHIVCADGWIFPVEKRNEGTGVLNRYNMSGIREFAEQFLNSQTRLDIKVPIYDRLKRNSNNHEVISIGPEDIVILEGVPVLLDEFLCTNSNVRIFVDVEDLKIISGVKKTVILLKKN